MPISDLAHLRRRERVGTLAWTAFGLGVLVDIADIDGILRFFCYFAAWILTAVWVEFDADSRCRRRFGWTFLTLLTGPLGFALYYLTRKPVPAVCSRCGTTVGDPAQACPTCGYATLPGRARFALTGVYTSLGNSLVRSPVEQAKETAKHISFALAAVSVIGALLLSTAVYRGFQGGIVAAIWVLSLASYWVLVAWWVYLDSTWRKMDGVPWAVLTLVTNVVGLVTYLVIRHPDPRVCVSCGASIPIGHKYCPFCGSEAESMCPHCQAAVKPGWQFCPVCAARLAPVATDAPGAVAAVATSTTIDISGSVLDAAQGTPIVGACVRIDSQVEGASAVTDSLGKFTLPGLDQRPHVLVASAEGYLPQAKAYSPGESARNLCFTLHIG